MKKNLPLFLVIPITISFIASALAQTSEMPTPKKAPKQPERTSTPPKISTPPPIYFPTRVNRTPKPSNLPSNAPTPVNAADNLAQAKAHVFSLLNNFAPEIQEIQVHNAQNAFVIKGNGGFEISFPAYALVDKDGNIVTGDVDIELTEYTNMADFAAARLTTQTTDGQMIETGGMINLEVSIAGEKLQLASGKSVEIKVPAIKKGQGYQTFYGTGAEFTTWSTTPVSANSDTTSYNSYTIAMAATKQKIKGETISFILFNSNENLEDYVNKNLKVKNEVRNAIKKAGIPFEYKVEIGLNGKIKKVYAVNSEVERSSLITPLHKQIVQILLDAPALNVTEGGLYANTPYSIMFKTKGSKDMVPGFKTYQVTDSTGKSVKETPSTVNEKNIGQDFSMSSQNLQKINCDRFSQIPGPRDTVAFQFDRADAVVYVVFKDIKSLMTPYGKEGKYVLKNVPEGQSVRYIAIVYDDQGNVKLGSVDSKISNSKIDFKELQPYNEKELKKMLTDI